MSRQRRTDPAKTVTWLLSSSDATVIWTSPPGDAPARTIARIIVMLATDPAELAAVDVVAPDAAVLLLDCVLADPLADVMTTGACVRPVGIDTPHRTPVPDALAVCAIHASTMYLLLAAGVNFRPVTLACVEDDIE